MTPKDSESLVPLKVAVTGIAVVALILRIAFPQLRIDAVSLGLLALALLPWLSPLIKSAELPGGLKIEFQEVKRAAEKVVAAIAPSGAPAMAPQPGAAPAPEPVYLAIADQDPNLALVGLRIEIEKRLRRLANAAGLRNDGPLTRMTDELAAKGILIGDAANGLRELIALGNQAAHGRPVSTDVALSAADFAPGVLAALDATLAKL